MQCSRYHMYVLSMFFVLLLRAQQGNMPISFNLILPFHSNVIFENMEGCPQCVPSSCPPPAGLFRCQNFHCVRHSRPTFPVSWMIMGWIIETERTMEGRRRGPFAPSLRQEGVLSTTRV
ncbi:hypothetical protein C8Q76DRAFT_433418 [Earliella scabrosa]|nr:hypothetical protein C8Q76DRAFT_433418 [Earliella scabrosa]